MSKTRDGIRDIAPDAKATEAILNAPEPEPMTGKSSDMAEVREALLILAKHNVSLAAAMTGVVGNQDRILKEIREDDERYQICKREAEKSAQQRTQERADAKWPPRETDKRYKVAHMSWKRALNPATGKMERQLFADQAFVVCEINAASEQEAKARYVEHCGILGFDHEKSDIRVYPATAPILGIKQKEDDEDARARARLESLGVVEVG